MFRILISIIFALAISSPASAVIYKYVDDNGVVHFTDAPVGVKVDSNEPQHNTSSGSGKATVRASSSYTVKSNFNSYVHEASKKYDIDPSLIHAVIKTESDYKANAVSNKGAQGLMQLMPTTAKEMGVYNPFNPAQNIDGGTKYLRQMLDKFDGDLELALAAYNSGPNRVEKLGRIPQIPETKSYVNKVLNYYGSKDGGSLGRGENKNRIYKVVLEDGTVLFTNSYYRTGPRTGL